jgi:hypothetical protein
MGTILILIYQKILTFFVTAFNMNFLTAMLVVCTLITPSKLIWALKRAIYRVWNLRLSRLGCALLIEYPLA